MKRIFYVAIGLFATLNISAQTLFEALRPTQYDITGSARYMSVAGAFGALGGDVSAIKDNPAGLGIFRKSELTTSLSAQLQSAEAIWDTKKATDNNYTAGLNNLNLVLAGKTWRAESGYSGLVSSNFSFSYNKLQNFNRNLSVKNNPINQSLTDYIGNFTGTKSNDILEWDNYPRSGKSTPYAESSLAWLSVMAHYGRLIQPVYNTNNELVEWASSLDAGEKFTPSYKLQETGGVNEYSMGWSGNFSNRIYVGATVNYQTIDYKSISTYDEDFSKGGGLTLRNTFLTSGKGVNLNVGIIAVPVDFIRIGLAVHTPTFFNMNQLNYSKLEFDSRITAGETETPTDNYVNYQLQSPIQLHVSTAYIIDKKGFISAEYVYNNYSGMKFVDNTGSSYPYSYEDENETIGSMLKDARTIKIGGEYKITDNFSARAGFANTSNMTTSDAYKYTFTNSARTDTEYFTHRSTNYMGFGLGYRENNWYVDFGFLSKTISEDFYAYDTYNLSDAYKINAAQVKSKFNNLVFTLGLRF